MTRTTTDRQLIFLFGSGKLNTTLYIFCHIIKCSKIIIEIFITDVMELK